jgi:hypothetical protein
MSMVIKSRIPEGIFLSICNIIASKYKGRLEIDPDNQMIYFTCPSSLVEECVIEINDLFRGNGYFQEVF